jgi:predicted dehydrogenase
MIKPLSLVRGGWLFRGIVARMKADDFINREGNRRQFLSRSACNAAGVAAGIVSLEGVRAASSSSDRVRIGVIGLRAWGQELLEALATLKDAEVVALCDVDTSVLYGVRSELSDRFPRLPKTVTDYRRLLDDSQIDAVIVATPDHWHGQITKEACAAGKDVYVEAPIGQSVEEVDSVEQAVRSSGRIVQVGLQQRSGAHYQSAVAAVQSGVIGRVRMARAWIAHRRKSIGQQPESQPPKGVDYAAWLGPVGPRPFHSNRFHQNWQWQWDFGGGELSRWGVHFLDVAAWGMGLTTPTRIVSTGGMLELDDDRQTPDTMTVHYEYPGSMIQWEHRQWTSHGLEGRTAGTAFYGSEGTLVVDRGGWKVYDRKESLTADASDLLRPHLQDFLDAVGSRRTPAAPIEVGANASRLAHWGNLAYRNGGILLTGRDV